ncbi:MAG TPA: 16S rRNA (guanine(966)-N(2))-methyltransferase RsmD [Acetobacteraceae bacterium]|jgi:16S rRNA (guanine966-N2)-methyltransferase|nr:16S rRNA (guanine(966)-N(2))-methyltransferase RsmD [Acetobacteraceae bacterium]
MRIVGGTWRGRALQAPRGATTRPTADRARQALFDMLLHAPWGGRQVVDGAAVLDVFAGTGALGLEALSRGAATARFIERDAAALTALRGNVAVLQAGERCTVLAMDVLAAPPGAPCGLVFLDPPYSQDLVPKALAHLAPRGWIAAGALIVAETARDEALPVSDRVTMSLLAERSYGAARVSAWRAEALVG